MLRRLRLELPIWLAETQIAEVGLQRKEIAPSLPKIFPDILFFRYQMEQTWEVTYILRYSQR